MAIPDYFVDFAADFVGQRLGTDHAGEELTGPGGLQIAIRGAGGYAGEFKTGGLVTGDKIGIRGTGPLTRLVKIDANGTDVSAWEIGDVVRNKTGAGDHWTGKVVQERDLVATGLAADDICLVQLDSPATFSDVNDNKADGIENTTRAESQNTIAAVTCVGIEGFLNSGAGVTGNIAFVGVAADWSEDGTVAVFDGGGDATNCLVTTGTHKDYLTFKYLQFTDATGDGVLIQALAASADYWIFDHCKFDNNGADGFTGAVTDFLNWAFRSCLFRDNASDGLSAIYQGLLRHCIMAGNAGWGVWDSGAVVICEDSTIYGNTSGGFQVDGPLNIVRNCAIDGNGGDGIEIDVGTQIADIFANRITNNAGYGLNQETARTESVVENYNVFYNNTSGSLNNADGGAFSYGDDGDHVGAPTSDGYTKRTLLVAYDNGVNMNSAQSGDVVTDGNWTGVLKSTPSGAVTGTFEMDTIETGNPKDDDAITMDATETCDINGHPAILETGANATDFNVPTGKENRSTALVIPWDV